MGLNSFITPMLSNKTKANSMGSLEQETQTPGDWEEVGEESLLEEQETGQETENEESKAMDEAGQQKPKKNERKRGSSLLQGKSGFVHGLAAGLGIGCLAAFVMMWMAVFFTPRLPLGITYEAMLATFIYPLMYIFALGLVTLTVGIASEYYSVKNEFKRKTATESID
jgi:hypothetical protein